MIVDLKGFSCTYKWSSANLNKHLRFSSEVVQAGGRRVDVDGGRAEKEVSRGVESRELHVMWRVTRCLRTMWVQIFLFFLYRPRFILVRYELKGKVLLNIFKIIQMYVYIIRARTGRFDLRYDSGVWFGVWFAGMVRGYGSRRQKPSHQHWPGIEPWA